MLVIRASDVVRIDGLEPGQTLSSGSIHIKNGAEIKNYNLRAFSISFNEDGTPTRSGTLYKYRLEGYHPKNRSKLQNEILALQDGEYIAVLVDEQDHARVIGTPENPCFFRSKGFTGRELGDRSGADLVFFGESWTPAPSIVNVDLDFTTEVPDASISASFVGGSTGDWEITTETSETSGTWRVKMIAKQNEKDSDGWLMADFQGSVSASGTDISTLINVTDNISPRFADDVHPYTGAGSLINSAVTPWTFEKKTWAGNNTSLYNPGNNDYGKPKCIEVKFQVQNAAGVWSEIVSADLPRVYDAWVSGVSCDAINGGYDVDVIDTLVNSNNYTDSAHPIRLSENGTDLGTPTSSSGTHSFTSATVSGNVTLVGSGRRLDGSKWSLSQLAEDTGQFRVGLNAASHTIGLHPFNLSLTAFTQKYGPGAIAGSDGTWEELVCTAFLQVKGRDKPFYQLDTLGTVDDGTQEDTVVDVELPHVGFYDCMLYMASASNNEIATQNFQIHVEATY